MNITIFFKELLTKKTLENNSCFLFRLWAMKCGPPIGMFCLRKLGK